MESVTDKSLLPHVQKEDIEVMVATRDSMMTSIAEEVQSNIVDAQVGQISVPKEKPR